MALSVFRLLVIRKKLTIIHLKFILKIHVALSHGVYVSTMNSAIASSLSGLQSATNSFIAAAEKIVSSGATSIASQSSSTSQTTGTLQSGRPLAVNLNPPEELARGIVDLKLAEFSYKASAKVLKVALDLDKTFIDQLK